MRIYVHVGPALDKLMLSRSCSKSTDAGDLLYKTVHPLMWKRIISPCHWRPPYTGIILHVTGTDVADKNKRTIVSLRETDGGRVRVSENLAN